MHTAEGDKKVSTAVKRYRAGKPGIIVSVVLFCGGNDTLCRNCRITAYSRGGMECCNYAPKGGCTWEGEIGAEMHQLSSGQGVEWGGAAGASCRMEPVGNICCYDILFFSVFFGPRFRG